MARDFRVRATLTAIDEALLSLVREKPLAQITIKELCDKAGIDRSTFYRHYHSVADVMESEEQRLLAELEGRLEAQHMPMEETLKMVLEAIKCDSGRYAVLFSEHGDASFPGRVLGVAYKHAQGNLDELYPQLSSEKKRWIFDYVAHGLSAIWKDWIEGGMVEPVSEVAQFATLLVECGTGKTSMNVEQYVMAYGRKIN